LTGVYSEIASFPSPSLELRHHPLQIYGSILGLKNVLLLLFLLVGCEGNFDLQRAREEHIFGSHSTEAANKSGLKVKMLALLPS